MFRLHSQGGIAAGDYIVRAWDLRPLRSRAAVHSLVSKLTHIYGNAV
jgi:hypothetical protein